MKKNIIANYIGRFWGVISNFLFVPLYINYLGLESFSIISLSLVITAVLAVMDSGLTSTLTREFASSQNSKNERFFIFKTLESSYFIISGSAIFFVIFGSDYIALNWLNLNEISPQSVSYYLKIIGIEIGFKFLVQFYTGGFLGLEKQVKINIYQIFWGITRNGLVLIPILFFPTLEVFFIWQTISTIIYMVIIRWDIYSLLTANRREAFFSIPLIQKPIIKRVWKFAGGMMLISLVASINTQLDKLSLSALLPIEILGLYTLAFSLSSGLNLITRPISMAVLPRMTFCFTGGRQEEGTFLFKKFYYLLGVLLFSFSASMIIFPYELIWIWTNDEKLAIEASIYVPFISLGTSFLAMAGLPFNVSIAHSYTKFNNILGILSLFITIPGYWVFTKHYGGIGAAATFAIVQIIITLLYLFLINKKFLKSSITTLYVKAFCLPFAISLTITYLVKNFISLGESRGFKFIEIGVAVLFCLIINIIILIPHNDIFKEYYKFKTVISKK